MKIRYERRKLAELVLDKENPRKISKAAKKALTASVRRFGLVQPIVVNESTGRVVGGHQRVAVLLEQGIKEVDVAIGSWTPSEERALNVALNNPGAMGEFTDVRSYLSDALSSLSLADFAELRFDKLILDGGEEKDADDNGEERELAHRLIIDCESEAQQAELIEEFDQRGLTVKVVIN
jgi:hypothetical protein